MSEFKDGRLVMTSQEAVDAMNEFFRILTENEDLMEKFINIEYDNVPKTWGPDGLKK